ncbi:hypothetical protein JO41_07325 [Treponema sp. OMZ 838]|uniref:hypothetical protein n=1 Tax=Treponema sp. OMZ 838 TaxID=1539298 RepID=UPI000530120E|nr:hypothetical protein [Treponema sp. OMZ 838]AIW89624.1 hypothetical protein JO41_07325 [Treponema sp. OMZ 838]
MIQHIKNYGICLINIFVVIIISMLFSCSFKETKQVNFYDYRIDDKSIFMTLEFKLQGRIYQRKISSNTKNIKLNVGSELFSIEHDSKFCTKVISNINSIDIYIFPNEVVKDNHGFYLLNEVKNVYAYFIEYYDENNGKNYYIFSKDNSIEKQSKINYTPNYLNELQELRDKDIAYYNEDVQVLAYPYAGYVVRGRDGTLLLLSTLWDNNSIN